jgi:hypothetical protein
MNLCACLGKVVDVKDEGNNSSYRPITVSPPAYTLSVNRNGNGTITSSPSGINCGSSCSQNYEYGSNVVLTASASSSRYTLYNWNGSCGGRNSQCSITMTSNKNVEAYFGIDCENKSIPSPSGNSASLNRIACGSSIGKSTYTITDIFYEATFIAVFHNQQVVISDNYVSSPKNATLIDWHYGSYDSNYGGYISLLKVKCGSLLSPCTTNITFDVNTGGYGELFDLYVIE